MVEPYRSLVRAALAGNRTAGVAVPPSLDALPSRDALTQQMTSSPFSRRLGSSYADVKAWAAATLANVTRAPFAHNDALAGTPCAVSTMGLEPQVAQ